MKKRMRPYLSQLAYNHKILHVAFIESLYNALVMPGIMVRLLHSKKGLKFDTTVPIELHIHFVDDRGL